MIQIQASKIHVYLALYSHGQPNVFSYFCSKFVKDNLQISTYHLTHNIWKQYQRQLTLLLHYDYIMISSAIIFGSESLLIICKMIYFGFCYVVGFTCHFI